MLRVVYLVMSHVPAQDIPSPSHPVNHSHNLRFQIKFFGTDFGTVGPGTKIKHTMTIMTAGASSPHRTNTVPLTVSTV